LVTAQAQIISFPSRTTWLDAYLARPDSSGPCPGVVIHKAFGLNENIKDMARRFAVCSSPPLEV